MYYRDLQSELLRLNATIPARRVAKPKAKMTEEEFRAKINASSAKAKAGHYVTMLPDETGEQFIKRICM